ncbi:hypothetical protein PQX77_006728 [Marasmius sp. AFHP31]|nr:hypothetical protein PQX77_006728 [Marasmius sp. AFHP31]
MAKISLNLALVFAFLAFQAGAAPLHRRQIGDAQCNAARLQTVSGLEATTKAVDQLASASANDEITSSAVAQAQEGLSDAQEGIKTIAQAISTGQDAPADARTQVGDGLESAQSALQSIQSTDPAVTSGVKDAMAQLAKTAQAGEQVVSLCGGGGAAGAAKGPAAGGPAAGEPAAKGPAAKGPPAGGPPAGGPAAGGPAADPAKAAKEPPAGGPPAGGPPAGGPPAGGPAAGGPAADPAKALGKGKRQIGSIQCNVARLQTVSGLSATTKAVDQLASAGANDEATSSAVAQAQEGLSDAQGGIQTIAQAILSGQDAPADARTQVGDGLESAQSALQSISSTDPAVTSGVKDAMAQLAKTAQAGEQVVSLCGGGGGAAGAGGAAGGAAANPASGIAKAFGKGKRQIGSVQCNVARLKTVKNLADTTNSVNAMLSAAGSDPATSSAAQSAQSGLSSAQDGIGQIAQAIVSLQKAPAAARDQTLQGLTDAKSALDSISS